MRQMSHTKRACICAACIALCYLLPIAFHAMGLGGQFSPMHIPVLLCGLICGPGYGAFCGIAGPVISGTTGMPTFLQLLYMIPELSVYALTAGVIMKHVRTRSLAADLYIALIPAMILGRVIGGLARMLVIRLLSTGEPFTLALWVSGYIVGTLPGIAVQLILLPVLVAIPEKAGLIPPRYPRKTKA